MVEERPSEGYAEYRSPLWIVTQEPHLTRLVGYLQQMAGAISSDPDGKHELYFSRDHLEKVREGFSQTIIRGESKLHRLGELVARDLFVGEYELSSVVIGEVEPTRERFTLVQSLSHEELSEQTDLDLGNRQLGRIRFLSGEDWVSASLVANFVEYQPVELNQWGVHKLISRIKAEEEIWNKVVDEIFEVDNLFRMDKELRHLSRFVKDIFGLKILVSEISAVRRLQRHLQTRQFSVEELAAVGVEVRPSTQKLEFMEVKDYLDSKESGWSALKSVVRWWGSTLEIQIQPLRNYLRERERLTKESHAGFKARRDQVRQELAERIPLYEFYRSLLRWLFYSPGEPQPTFPGVTIEVE